VSSSNIEGDFMTQKDLETIRQIQDAVQGTWNIPASQVRVWLHNPSVEVLGAVTEDIIRRQSRRVDPPLSMEEICSAVQEYYRQCLIQNLQDSDYASNRSIAGLEFVGWFHSLWRDSAVPREYLVRMKTMLRDLCTENRVPQDEIVGAVLEHLFERLEFQEFFADWKCDPLLSRAFAHAKEWGDDHLSRSIPHFPV
jgi:hypothetical protein